MAFTTVSPFSASLRSALLIGLCTAALTMGACRGDDKSLIEEITVETASLGLSGADEKALSRHFRIAPRTGTEAASERVLEGLGLQAGSDLQAESRVIDGSNVTYLNWRVEAEDTIVTADKVVLTGLHDVDGRAQFDRMEVTNLIAQGSERVENGAESFRATVDQLIVVEPSPDLAAELAGVLRGSETDLTGAGGLPGVAEEETFRGLKLDNLVLRVTETDETGASRIGDGQIGQIILGFDRDAESADAVIETVKFDWFGNDRTRDDGIKLEMDGLTVLGLDTSEAGAMPGMTGLAAMGLSAISSPSLRAPYREVDLGPLSFDSRAFDVKMDGFEANSDTKGGVTQLKSVLSLMTVNLKDLSETQFAPYADALAENGFSEITLKGSQVVTLDKAKDLVTVSDARTEIDGGLRLDCDYVISGSGASQDFIDESGLSAPEFAGFDSEEKMEAFFAEMETYQRMQAEAKGLIKLNDMRCSVQDVAANSLVNRGYAMASSVTGSPVPVLKGSAKTMIALGSLTAPTAFQRDLMDNVGSGLIKFLDKPGQTMTVKMSPSEPVSLSALAQRPDEASLSALNLTVEVE